MKPIAASSILAALLIAFAACTQSGGQDAPTAIPTGASPAAVTETHTALPTVVPPPSLALLPTATAVPPVPTPTSVAPTSEPPTATPRPTATPPPTATPTPVPTATPQPTPQATPTPVPPPSGPAKFDLGGGAFLSVTPREQFAGRDISFILSGLTPWQPVRVSFINPQGVAASWTTADDVRLLDRNGAEATSFLMYPTASGELGWERYGTQDGPGAWSVDIDLDGIESSTAYTLVELKLGGQETAPVGADLTRYSGSGSTIYYSDLVPTALVIDLQEHLRNTALLMERQFDTEMGQLPDLYLAGNDQILDQITIALGIDPGFESGYYKSFGDRPGIYIRTDLTGTEVRRLLTHEYVHLVFDVLANKQPLPAWLTEGLSRYYEFDVALSGPRANASLPRQFRAADEARAAAQAGSLFGLNSLDSRPDWNQRTDEDQISLQYAQTYMAVRYLNETFGPQSAKELVEEIGRGIALPSSIRTVTGLELTVFESQFNLWLEDWEDPVRASIAEYLAALELILSDQDAILDQRSTELTTQISAGEAAKIRVARLTSTEALLDRAQSLSPPEAALDLHQEAKEYLGRVLEWLTLEFQHANARDDFYRVAGNAMIPEINARDFLLQRSRSNLQFILHLDR